MKVVFFIIFFIVLLLPTQAFAQNPEWVRNIAYWWSQGQVSDAEFNEAIKFLIENNIITLDNIMTGTNVVDRGDFFVYYQPTDNYYDIAIWLQDNEDWTLNISHINQIKLPYDVEIVFEECGFANAGYYNAQISMCYELVDEIIQIQSQYYTTEEEIRFAVQDAVYFIFLHELGHALIDLHNIPYTGKEEDAVDQLATIILLTEGQQGVDALYASANYWYEIGRESIPYEHLPFHDEHSFSMQRFYAIICFVYGYDPENNSNLLDIIPESGEYLEWWHSRCIEDHNRISNSWNLFLNPLWN